MKFRKPPSLEIDPLVKSLTIEKVEGDIATFASLLGSRCDEQDIQNFLAQHSYFFNGIIRLFGCSPLYSKIRLVDHYEIDFLCFDSGSLGPEWHLIARESPSKNIFTKSGD